MKKRFFMFLVWAVIFGMACDALAILIWVKNDSWSSHGDLFIYNDTDAYIYLDPNDEWNKHKDVKEDPNPIGPYGSKMCTSWNVKTHGNQKGTLHVYIETTEGDKDSADDFKIEARNKSGDTYYTLELPSDDNVPKWVFKEKKQDPDSGAWSIYDVTADPVSDIFPFVGQMYNEQYVVTFFSNFYSDHDKFSHNGDTRIILLISKNGPGRFNNDIDDKGSNSRSVESNSPQSWANE